MIVETPPALGRNILDDHVGGRCCHVIEPSRVTPIASADQLPTTDAAGAVLTPRTITSLWRGETCDYATAVAALLPRPAAETMVR